MKVSSFMKTNARAARPRSTLSGTTALLEPFRTGDCEVVSGASARSNDVAAIGEQGNGGRVSAGGEDV